MATSSPYSWFDPRVWLNLPFGGSVAQNYHPWTAWFSPQLDMQYIGTPSIEREITEKVAGYGSQSGTLTDVLLAMTKDERGSPAIAKLRKGLGSTTVWRNIGGVFPIGRRAAAIARNADQLDAFITGNDGRVYTSWWPHTPPNPVYNLTVRRFTTSTLTDANADGILADAGRVLQQVDGPGDCLVCLATSAAQSNLEGWRITY